MEEEGRGEVESGCCFGEEMVIAVLLFVVVKMVAMMLFLAVEEEVERGCEVVRVGTDLACVLEDMGCYYQEGRDYKEERERW